MTESEFNELIYSKYVSLLEFEPKSSIDENDLLWMAAMWCAMEVDRDAVERYCDKDKVYGGYKLQKVQFTQFKKIALRDKKIKEVDIKTLHDQFLSRMRKEKR